MGDSSKWDIDDNGYYRTDYHYSQAVPEFDIREELYSEDMYPINHTVTFEEGTNIKISYAVGKMSAGQNGNPSVGLYYDAKSADNSILNNISMTTDNLGSASNINSIVSNPIELTDREITLENITELTIKTVQRPVLWIDYIQIEILD